MPVARKRSEGRGTATLVLLLLNPRHSPDDPAAHAQTKFKETILQNLRGKEQAYLFYPLDPAFSDTPSAKWWRPRLRNLHPCRVAAIGLA